MDDGLESRRGDAGAREADVRTLATEAGELATQPDAEARLLTDGTLVAGNFRIVRTIGTGGMGVVYEAVDTMLERRVAVKLRGVDRDREDAARTWREAKAMARLSHPNVVTVYEVAWHEGALCIAMELVEGSDARQWAAAQPRSLAEILDVYVQACEGLAAAHRIGIVHRDFKPDNVLVGADGRVRVADFGVARFHDAADPVTDPVSAPHRSDSAEPVKTRTGALLGTPAYMAPEQVAGTPASPAADQFACCAAIYEALHGVRPFTGSSIGARFLAIEHGRFEAPTSGRLVPGHIAAAIRRGLAFDPTRRWPSVDALVVALKADPVRRRRRIALALACAAALAATTWALAREPELDRCVGLRASGAEVWNDTRGAELAAQFVAAGSPQAAAAADIVAGAFAPWADAWGAAREEACRATWARGEQSEERLDQRIACLARQRVDAEAMLAVLASADAEAIARVGEVVRRLPAPASCAEPDSMLARDRVSDAEEADYLHAHAAIAEADAQCAAANPRRCAELVDVQLAAIDAAGWSWLEARARLLRGGASAELGLDDRALADRELALVSAFATGDLVLQIEAMLALARSLGRSSLETAGALRWIDTAEAMARRIDATPKQRLLAGRVRVEVLSIAFRHPEAEAAARALLADLVEDDADRARVLAQLSVALRYQRRGAEAVAVSAQALAMAERVAGPASSVALEVSANHVMAVRGSGDLEEALALSERALATAEQVYGPDAPTTGAFHRLHADCLSYAGRYREAIAEFEAALVIARRHHDGVDTIYATVNLASVFSNMGDTARALTLLEGAVADTDAFFGVDSLRAGQVRVNLAGYLIGNLRWAEALPVARASLALFERHLGPADRSLVPPLANLALVLAHEGDADGASAAIERAGSLFDPTNPAADALEHARYLGARGGVFDRIARHREAIAAYEQSVGEFERAYAGPHPDLQDALYALTRALIDGGRPAEAISTAERAIAVLEQSEAEPGRRAQLEFELARAQWPDRTRRKQAIALAKGALARLRELDHADVTTVEAWLATHP